jgi:hypothetical protein
MLSRWNGRLPTVHRLPYCEAANRRHGALEMKAPLPTGIFAFITNFLYLE